MMSLLLIVEATEAPGPVCAAIADGDWSYDSTNWDSFSFSDCSDRSYGLVIAAITPDQPRSLEFFRWLQDHPGHPPVIVVLPAVAQEICRNCMDMADDFVFLPIQKEELRRRVVRLVQARHPGFSSAKDRLVGELGLSNLIGNHPEFLKEVGKITRAAASDGDVLVTGETGTGKELCARAVHHLSRRRNQPLICVDCGGVPDQLFESEIFGHVRGAFTDAHRTQKGLVAMAEGGTLFLDEIDSLSMHAQTKLLRFLQDRTYRPLGSEQFHRADVRIVAATNGDLQQAIEGKTFRRDLFFRINVLRLHMIPLRTRAEDIELLANHFLDLFAAETDGRRKTLSRSALQALRAMKWPGNVRELQNAIRRAVVFSDGPQLLPSHFVTSTPANADEVSASFRDARRLAIDSFERQYVEQLLRKHGGNITQAARDANKDRRAFGRLVKRCGIQPRSLSLQSSQVS